MTLLLVNKQRRFGLAVVRLSSPRRKLFKMADGVDKKLSNLEKLKNELILDCCSYRLWQQFRKGSKMTDDLLQILRSK